MSSEPPEGRTTRAAEIGARDPLFYLGAAALLLAMAVDALGVLARHVGVPLLGALEIVQACIVLASSASLVYATRANRHAAAHFLLDRCPPRMRLLLAGISRTLTLLFFLVLAVGQGWIAHDLWNGHEDSELLHIPFAPLRALSIAAVLLAAASTLRQMLRPGRAP